jgi:UDP:flavonoid glycosyltransferase YjiC (YdhE family)
VADTLASDSPVAYFTLGTVKNADPRDFRTGLSALEGYDGTVIATTGRRLGSEELGHVPANAVVAEFVPQVALPRGTDQPENAALLVRAGAGVLVAPEDYAVESIADAVTEVTRDPAFRAAAELVRDEIDAMPDADAAWGGITF